jgi:hypothetical protein
MIIDFTEFSNDIKSYIDRKFEDERDRNVKVKDYEFPERVFKMPDIEAYLNMSKKVIIKAIKDDKLKAFKVDRDWRTTKEELDKYLDLLFIENKG